MAAAPTIYANPSTYWSVLFETLSTVFKRKDAADLVAKVKREIQQAPVEEQLLFFHTEPFSVAVEVTGMSANPTLLSAYLALVQQLNWGP
jgi:hypothetical protein